MKKDLTTYFIWEFVLLIHDKIRHPFHYIITTLPLFPLLIALKDKSNSVREICNYSMNVKNTSFFIGMSK